MTQANFRCDNGYWRIRIWGHAQYAEAGKDIVCSAASMLTYTLGECLVQENKQGHLRDCRIHLEGGDAVIDAVAAPGHEAQLQCIVQVIQTGFKLLAQTYPTHVTVG